MAARGVSPTLVGRREELELLRDVIRRAADGEPGTVLLGGEAGIGKSRLVQEVCAEQVAAGVRVLTGSCVEGGGEGMAFAPVVDIFRDLARSTPPEALDEVLGRARPDVARLLPELATADQPPSVAATSAQLFELLLAVLDRLSATAPVLLVIEDLHWADASTLDFLGFLVRAIRGERLAVVATYRSDELRRGHQLRSLLTGWERGRSVTRLELSRFTEDQVGQQLTAIMGTRPAHGLVRTVYDRSEGNAFLVEEILGAVEAGADVDQLPDSLRDVLLSRVDQLSDQAREVVRTASIAGRWVAERLLARVTELPDRELYAALREAVESHLLVVDGAGRGYTFRHALTRDAVYSDMLPGERGALHQAYAEVLAADPGLVGDETSVAATLAYHWYAALDLPRALETSLQAATVASSSAAFAEALRHLERALEVWPRVPDAEARTGATLDGLLADAATCAYKAGQLERAKAMLDRALTAPASTSDLAVRLPRLQLKALIEQSNADDAAAVATLTRALELLGEDGEPALRATVLASIARVLTLTGDPADCVGAARSALEAAKEVSLPSCEADAMVSLGSSLAYSESPEAGLPWLHQAYEMVDQITDPLVLLRTYINYSDVLEMAARHEQAEQIAAEGVRVARDVGFSRSLGPFINGNRMEPLLRLGRWDEAEQIAAEELRGDLSGVFRSSIVEILARIAVSRGDLEAAEAHNGSLVVGGHISWQYAMPLVINQAEIGLNRRDVAAARAPIASALVERGTSALDDRYLLPMLMVGYRIEAELGREAPESSLLSALEELRPQTSPSTPAGAASYALLVAERDRALDQPTREAWTRAVDAAAVATDLPMLAYARLRLAEVLLREGDRPGATALVHQVLAFATPLRARPLVEAAEALARDGRLPVGQGLPADTGATLSSYRLTDRERVVLAHLAAGRSNADIAAALYISPKTASVHVSNLMAKLGVANRVEAAALAYRLGVAPA